MRTKHVVIDPVSLAKALRIPWRHPQDEYCETGGLKEEKNIYEFPLGEDGRQAAGILVFDVGRPRHIVLRTETANGYSSSISFKGITRVELRPEYRSIRFVREQKGAPASLRVWWRGDFELHQ